MPLLRDSAVFNLQYAPKESLQRRQTSFISWEKFQEMPSLSTVQKSKPMQTSTPLSGRKRADFLHQTGELRNLQNEEISERHQSGGRAVDLERILSEEGCNLRMNRSIQAEGSFGELKQEMGFRCFLCRGTQNVEAESILLAMAHNLNKLHNKIQAERTGIHLFKLKK